jgi:hypothetical protein
MPRPPGHSGTCRPIVCAFEKPRAGTAPAVKRPQIKGFFTGNDLEFPSKLRGFGIDGPAPVDPSAEINTAIGHWHRAVLQLFLIVNQEIDQWRAAP